MNPLLLDILLALRDGKQFGLSVEILLPRLRAGDHRGLTVPQLETALRDLADQTFVTSMRGPLGGVRWRITAVGISALEEIGT